MKPMGTPAYDDQHWKRNALMCSCPLGSACCWPPSSCCFVQDEYNRLYVLHFALPRMQETRLTAVKGFGLVTSLL
eukprot:3776235-Amphidinium_carterae.1